MTAWSSKVAVQDAMAFMPSIGSPTSSVEVLDCVTKTEFDVCTCRIWYVLFGVHKTAYEGLPVGTLSDDNASPDFIESLARFVSWRFGDATIPGCASTRGSRAYGRDHNKVTRRSHYASRHILVQRHTCLPLQGDALRRSILSLARPDFQRWWLTWAGSGRK